MQILHKLQIKGKNTIRAKIGIKVATRSDFSEIFNCLKTMTPQKNDIVTTATKG